MRFHRPARSRNQVMIIPLIDILLFLLIFFMASTQFKKPRQVLRIELPTVREVPSDTVVETRAVLAADASGNVTLDGLKVPDGMLDMHLTAFLKVNPGRKLELEADRKLPLENLLAIWDSLRKSGIQVGDVPARILKPDK